MLRKAAYSWPCMLSTSQFHQNDVSMMPWPAPPPAQENSHAGSALALQQPYDTAMRGGWWMVPAVAWCEVWAWFHGRFRFPILYKTNPVYVEFGSRLIRPYMICALQLFDCFLVKLN